MKEEYDFTNPRPNPFTAQYKNEISIKVTDETLAFLKEKAFEYNIPYGSLASRFLEQCAKRDTVLQLESPVMIRDLKEG